MSKKVEKNPTAIQFFPYSIQYIDSLYFSFIVKSVKQSLEQTAADSIKQKKKKKKGVDHTDYFFTKYFMYS